MKLEYTSKGLSKITPETLDALTGRYLRRKNGQGTDWGTHLTEVKRRMINEDPVLVEFLEMQVDKYPPELHNPMFEIATGLYALLELQTEANKLKEDLSK